MGVSLRRFPDLNVSLLVLKGEVSAQDLLDFGRRMEPDGAQRRWINYVDPAADLSQLDLATFTELKRLVALKLRTQFPDGRFSSAIVCDSRLNDPIIRLWSNYVGRDAEHPARPAVFSTLVQAFDYLDLEPEARAALTEALGLPASPTSTRGEARA
jgi:hypothetical protein